MTGPVQKGLNTRFDEYKAFGGGSTVTIGGTTKPIEDAFPPDPNIYENQPPKKKDDYTGITFNTYTAAVAPSTNWLNPTHTASPHRREILMPIINESEFQAGKDEVNFSKFGKFFMNRRVSGNNEIFVEFLEPAFGSGGFDPNGGPTSPIVVPVLYR
jgi:hypothetical protein